VFCFRVSPKTVLTYCTDGVLLRTLMGGDSTLATVTHIVVDEVHERNCFSDFLLIALRDSLAKFRSLRLVLMSATVDTHIFTKYFNNCPVIIGNVYIIPCSCIFYKICVCVCVQQEIIS
jgi:HrpA-like RNA helicase